MTWRIVLGLVLVLVLLAVSGCRRAPADATEAAQRGTADEMRAFLDADPRVLSSGGHLALAAEAGNIPVLELLLQRGADPDHRDERGDTALHKAARAGQTRAILVLAHHGADWRIQNGEGRTPLRVAVIAKQRRAEDELREIGTRRFRSRTARPTEHVTRLLAPDEIRWAPAGDGEEAHELWGRRAEEQHLALVRWPPGFARAPHTHEEETHLVVVEGTPEVGFVQGTSLALARATALTIPGGVAHEERCTGASPCVLIEHALGGQRAAPAALPRRHPGGVRGPTALAGAVSPRAPHLQNSSVLWSVPDGETGMAVHAGRDFPGEGRHWHPAGYYLFVLEGRGDWRVEGESRVMGAGSVVRIPARTVHDPDALEDTLLFIVWDGNPATILVER